MPMPSEYAHASEDFEKFLAAVIEISGLTTRNQAYTTTEGVFRTFRRRLDVPSAIRFASVLPPVLRALFVSDWDTAEPRAAFLDRTALTREAQALRGDHNFSPDTCIRDVATALRENVDEGAFDQVLSSLPEGADEFWST